MAENNESKVIEDINKMSLKDAPDNEQDAMAKKDDDATKGLAKVAIMTDYEKNVRGLKVSDHIRNEIKIKENLSNIEDYLQRLLTASASVQREIILLGEETERGINSRILRADILIRVINMHKDTAMALNMIANMNPPQFEQENLH